MYKNLLFAAGLLFSASSAANADSCAFTVDNDGFVIIGGKCSADVSAYAERFETCLHFGGEEAYDDDRAAYIEKMTAAAGCETLEEDREALQKKYEGNKAESDLLRAIEESSNKAWPKY